MSIKTESKYVDQLNYKIEIKITATVREWGFILEGLKFTSIGPAQDLYTTIMKSCDRLDYQVKTSTDNEEKETGN